MTPSSERLYRVAFSLAVFTILYNVLEGLASMFFGFTDESLALFGFGADSFIEVISGIGIASMILRIRKNGTGDRDASEKTALKVTGTAFYMLVAGLIITSAYNLFTGHKPEKTLWGVIIAVVSILTMVILVQWKLKVGRSLDSGAIIADAHCTRVCIYMSVVLLCSSVIYELTGFGWIDIAGSLGLAWLSYKEGRECFEKARTGSNCACHTSY